jgi:MICOS complex subunit MIC60
VTIDTSKASIKETALSKGASPIETGTVKTPRKKGFGFSKFILSITFLTGIAYGGSVYYSLKNDNFRDAFIKYVYGAEKSVEYVEDLQRQGIFDRFEKNDTIKKGKDVVDKVIQTFKLTPTEEPSITKVQRPPAKDIEDPILLKLNNTLNELINILNNYNVKDKDDLIKRAQEELKELETHVKLLKIEDQAKIQFRVDEQTKKYDQLYALKEKKADEFLKMKEHELKQQSEDEKHRLYEQHYEQLKIELARESAKRDEEFKNELVRQAVEMQRRWIRDVRFMVEQERGGRLARLDRINHYFKILERISVDNAEHLDNSLKAHRLWCALRSLQDAVEQPHRTPFVNQINAMRHLSSTDEVVAIVLSTIDDNVANNGIDSISDLSARFAIVREEVRRASLVSEDGGVFAHLLSLIFSKILFRKHGLVKGDDVESILARVQYYLNENDLNTATRELNQLKGWPKKLAEDWIKAARNHLEIKQAIEVCIYNITIL